MIVVFDIDGTLTRSREADALAFASAFRATFGVPLPTTDWSAYRHATSAGILEEALVRVRGRSPTAEEGRAMQVAFRAELERALPEAGLAVPGAATVLDRLRARGHAVAIATGAWRWEGERKLARAGIAHAGVAFASSDDHADRAVILRTALVLAGWRFGTPAVYVGDGPWDVRAARALDVGFVGVDVDGDGRLAAMGCERVLADLTEADPLAAAGDVCANGIPFRCEATEETAAGCPDVPCTTCVGF